MYFLINSLVKEVGKPKVSVPAVSAADELKKKIAEDYKKEMADAFAKKAEKEFGGDEVIALAKTIAETYGTQYSVKAIEEALDGLFKRQVREQVLTKSKRFDTSEAADQ